jgi:hypothetical protein
VSRQFHKVYITLTGAAQPDSVYAQIYGLPILPQIYALNAVDAGHISGVMNDFSGEETGEE